MWTKGLDEIDQKILKLLLKNGRASYSEIASAIGLSRTAVKNRILSLEEKGMISGYTAVIQPQKTLYMMPFILHIETKTECFEAAKQKLQKAKEVATIVQTTGNCRLMMICLASCVDEIKTFVNRIYKQTDGITQMSVHAVLDTVKGSIIPKNYNFEE